jgi:hypothetical protein
MTKPDPVQPWRISENSIISPDLGVLKYTILFDGKKFRTYYTIKSETEDKA